MKGTKMNAIPDFVWGVITGGLFVLVIAMAWQQI